MSCKPKLFEMPTAEPWFSYIRSGEKTVEGRKNSPTWCSIKAGDRIKFINPHNEYFFAKVTKVNVYKDFRYDALTEYLINEGIANCLPGITTLEAARQVYLNYFRQEDIDQYGMMAIRVKVEAD